MPATHHQQIGEAAVARRINPGNPTATMDQMPAAAATERVGVAVNHLGRAHRTQHVRELPPTSAARLRSRHEPTTLTGLGARRANRPPIHLAEPGAYRSAQPET
ncbi:hypothetical protein GCM10010522_48310 [Kribbella solani]